MQALAPHCKALGDAAMLTGRSGAVWGALLRTSAADDGVFKPLVVSVGHGLCLESSLALIRRLCRYRIPEPVRQARPSLLRSEACACINRSSSSPGEAMDC